MATYDYIKGPNEHKIQVESAKRDGAGKNIENNYAKQDGFYGTMGVGNAQVAEQIANVSEDVGSTQEEPFIFQATATDNGLDSVETAPIAKHLEKQGNSVVVNQKCKGNFSVDTEWNKTDATLSVSNNVGTMLASAQNGRIIQTIPVINTHKYLIYAQIKLTTGTTSVFLDLSQTGTTYTKSTTDWQTLVNIATANQTLNWYIRIVDNRSSGWDAIQIKNVQVIDLTQWGFTADEIADITANPSHFFNYYNGSLAYNTGTLTNSNGRYLKCIGRNQWNEEWEGGSYDVDTGEKTAWNNAIRSKGFTRCLPNTYLYLRFTSTAQLLIFWYDENKKYIGWARKYSTTPDKTVVSPSNASFFTLGTANDVGGTYHNDITISIYYADGTDYDQYFPYEENTYDTGTEELRSAGSVRDIKLPDGSITRKVGFVDLSALNYTYSSTYGYWYSEDIASLIKKPSTNGDTIELTSTLYENVTYNSLRTGSPKVNSIGVNISGGIAINNGSSTTQPSGTLNYELATPTEEQGTSFAENVIVDNYGSMGWLDTDSNFVSVPQGSEFFYPADYVEFLDSLYTRSKDGGTSADVSNIVVASELTPFTNTDTQLQNAIGGTLRHLLASSQNIDFLNTAFIDLGTLTWGNPSTAYGVKEYNSNVVSGIKIPADNNTIAKIVCSSYKANKRTAGVANCIMVASDGSILITDQETYTGTEFKTAMKGVLLAYEKA